MIKMNEEIKCEWPGCKGKHYKNHELELINEKESSVNLPFCMYHFYIIIGGLFKVTKDEDNQFMLVGPFQEIGIIEQVMGAREMIKAFKNDNKDLKALKE